MDCMQELPAGGSSSDAEWIGRRHGLVGDEAVSAPAERQPAGQEDDVMISREGSFKWQAYALTGYPDFLNYLNVGDASREQLWEFYRRRGVKPHGRHKSIGRAASVWNGSMTLRPVRALS
jgi:hypothetical protein